MSHVPLYRTTWDAREAAAVLGFSRHASPLDIVNQKKGKASRPDERLARKLQRVALDSYVERTELAAIDRRLELIRRPRYPHLIVRPDAKVHAKEWRLVQANSCAYADRNYWGKTGTEAIPTENLIRAQLELGFWDSMKACDVCVLFGGSDFRIYTVQFNRELFEALAEALEQAWRDWIEGTLLPPVDASEACFKALSEKFAHRKNDVAREATEPEAELLKEAFKIRKEMRPKERRLKEIANTLKTFIGEGYGVFVNGLGRALFQGGKEETAVVTDWEKLAEAALLYLNAKDPGYGRELLAEHRREKTTTTNRPLKFYEE